MSMFDQVYSGVVQYVVLPAGDRVFGQRMMQRLALLRQAQTWAPDRLITYRDAQLRQLVETAYTETAHYRQAIEGAFKARITDTYGIGEGVQVAAQCGQGTHYHIHTPDVVVEFVDDAGQPVPTGQLGRILLTRLHAGPMPLIRYEVGDVGVSGGWRPCPCGRGYEIMESIQGRDTDIITTPSGNRLIVHFFTGILEFFPQIEVFQVLQELPDIIRLLIVPKVGYSEAVGEEIVRQLKEKGADIDIRVELVQEIPPASSGKRRFVINKLPRT